MNICVVDVKDDVTTKVTSPTEDGMISSLKVFELYVPPLAGATPA